MSTTADKPVYVPKLNTNRCTFAGKVLRKNFKYSTNGKAFGSVQVEMTGEKFRTTVWLKFFGETAEQGEAEIQDSGNYWFFTHMKNSSFEDKTTGERKFRDEFIVDKFGPVTEE